jgi:DNA-binding response OmpR family regulator
MSSVNRPGVGAGPASGPAPTGTATVLVVEDEPAIATAVARRLAAEGYQVETVGDGLAAVDAAARLTPDVVVLDVMLPGIDGLEVCRRIQAERPVPVLMLTARDDETDMLIGLGVGADDYMTKPFSMRELVARVKALLRRVDALAQNTRLDAGSLSIDGLTIDPLARDARLAGERLNLTPREFDLLYFFARQPGKVFSRMDLLNAVWGYQHEGYEHTVNTHINRLRAKIEADPAQPARILTVWGRGYKFAEAGEGA